MHWRKQIWQALKYVIVFFGNRKAIDYHDNVNDVITSYKNLDCYWSLNVRFQGT